MITRYSHDKLTWVDVENPTHEEVRALMSEFSLDPLVAEELLTPSLRPKAEVFDDHLYVVLHFPAARHSHTASHNQEVDFIIAPTFIITTRYDMVDPLHKFSKVFEVNSVLDRSDLGDHGAYLLAHMLGKLYRSILHELDYLSDRLEEAESRIFEGFEKEMVVELSRIGRDILNFKQALGSHRETLISLETAATSLFGEKVGRRLRVITGDYYRVQSAISMQSDSLEELRATNNSLVTTKQNEIMKILTIMAFVTFPLSLIAGIFGMNTNNIPIVGHPFDFWIITGGMVTGTIAMFAYFKHQRWL